MFWGLMEGKRQVKYIVCQIVINAMGKGRIEDRYPGGRGSGLQKDAI